MNFNSYNPKFIKLLTFIPPLFGIVVFSYIVKFLKIYSVDIRLPMYQGLMSFFSLISMGFMYVRDKNAIYGKKILPFLTLVYLFPILVYISKGTDSSTVIIISSIFFINSCILYLLLLNDNFLYYLFYSAINSIILPFTLCFNLVYLFIYLCISFYTAYLIFKSLKYKLIVFKFSENGFDILKSIFIHSPFLIFPFFDYKIQEIIGANIYSNYVLLNKYINGGITILFSYTQFKLIYSANLKNINSLKLLLFVVTFIMLSISWINNFFVFSFILFLYSLGVNLSSLLVRNELINGLSIKKSLFGLIFVFIYMFSLNVFSRYISSNNNIFILLMFLFVVIPCILTTWKIYKK